VNLYYANHLSGGSYRTEEVRLLPVDEAWLDRIAGQEWPTHALPLFTMDRDALFSALIRQYVFISLFRALAESLASENAARLASMQGAEKYRGTTRRTANAFPSAKTGGDHGRASRHCRRLRSPFVTVFEAAPSLY